MIHGDELLGRESDTTEIRETLFARLHVPTLTFPAGWTMSGPWRRAQEARAVVGSVDAARFRVMLSRPDAAPDLGALSPSQREVFVRCDQDGAAPCDVATETERHPSTVRTHLQRARERLADAEPEMGDPHRVLFCIHNGELAAECDCSAWRYNKWCSHVARLWWDWSRGEITVCDLRTDNRYLHPPAWLRVTDHDLDAVDVEGDSRARADGGERR